MLPTTGPHPRLQASLSFSPQLAISLSFYRPAKIKSDAFQASITVGAWVLAEVMFGNTRRIHHPQAIRDNPHLKAGLNVGLGQVTHEAVAQALGLAYVPAERVLV